MKLLKLVFLGIFPFIIAFSCNNKPEKTDLQVYLEKSEELITQIISENEYFNCIIEPWEFSINDYQKNRLPKEEYPWFKQKTMEALKITNDSSYLSLNSISKNFILKKSFFSSNLNFIERSYFDHVINENGYLAGLQILREANCKDGIISFSKPIFNSKYNLAVVYSEDFTSGSYDVYKLVDSKWKKIDSFGFWISN